MAAVEFATPRRSVREPLLVGGILAAGTLLVAVRDPHQGGYGMCPFLAVTGLWCPVCGGLRATHDLATLDLAGAWAMNPLLTVLLPLLALGWGVWLFRSVTSRPAMQPPAWLIVAIGVATMVFGVLRNIPSLHPYLGPH